MGALAGTIELQSAGIDTLSPLSARALVSDRGDAEASLGGVQELGDGFASLSGRWDRGPGFHTTPIEQRVPASARSRYESWSLEGRGVAPVAADLELQARMLVFDDQRTLRFDDADSTSSGADASLRFVGTGPWAFDVLGYIQSRNFSNVVVSSTRFVPVLDQRSTPSTGLGGKIEIRPPVGGDHTLRVGADFRRSSGALSELAISAFTGAVTARRSAGGVTSDLGLFVEDDWQLGSLTLTAGLRGDRTVISHGFFLETDGSGRTRLTDTRFPDRTNWTPSARAGARLEIATGLSLRAAGYKGFRIPTLNELYRPFSVFPVVTQANAVLDNEELEGFEVGVNFVEAGKAQLSITAFDNRIGDAIANVTIGENLRERQNVEAIKVRGLEFDGNVTFERLEIAGSLALVDASVQAPGLNGNRPAQTPEIAANLSASYRIGRDNLVRLTARHVGDQFEDDQEDDLLPEFTTFDVYAEVPVASFASIVLRAENLSNVRRIVRNQGGSIDLGAPRTLWIGLNFGR